MKKKVFKVIKANDDKFSLEFGDHSKLSNSIDVINRFIRRFESNSYYVYQYKKIFIGHNGPDDFKNSKVTIVIDFESRF